MMKTCGNLTEHDDVVSEDKNIYFYKHIFNKRI